MEVMNFLVSLMIKYPEFGSALMIIGILRSVFKPLQLVAQAYVDASPSKDDNEKLAKIYQSKVFKVIAWLLDYTASIKIPEKK